MRTSRHQLPCLTFDGRATRRLSSLTCNARAGRASNATRAHQPLWIAPSALLERTPGPIRQAKTGDPHKLSRLRSVARLIAAAFRGENPCGHESKRQRSVLRIRVREWEAPMSFGVSSKRAVSKHFNDKENGSRALAETMSEEAS